MTRPLSLRRNLGYAIASNSTALLVSLISVLFIPKILTVADYGYWQFYLLVVSFVGIVNLGLNDGVYLRYGGARFESLDRPVLSGMFWLVLSVSVVIGAAGVGLALTVGGDYASIWAFVSLAIPITNVRSLLSYVLQATNRIQEYSMSIVVDRGLFVLGLAIMFVFPWGGTGWLMSADLVARAASLVLVCVLCVTIVRIAPAPRHVVSSEAARNIRAGSKLLAAGLASQGILGVIRLSIERTWGIEAFGNVALVLSAAHFFSTFILAIALALFPWLRTLEHSRIQTIYLPFRDLLSAVGFASMLLYAPIFWAFGVWFPNYSEAVTYLVLLFPLVVYEAKISLLVTTYLNVLRKERMLLLVNLSALAGSLLISLLIFFAFDDIRMAVGCMFIVQAGRALLGEALVSRYLNVRTIGATILEAALAITFLVCMSYSPWMGSGVYAAALAMFFAVRHRAYRAVVLWLRETFHQERGQE